MAKTIFVKLFNKSVAIKLFKEGIKNIFTLKNPVQLKKKNIISGLVNILRIPKSITQYLPNSIKLELLDYNEDVNPSATTLKMDIDFNPLFKSFKHLFKITKGTITIKTKNNILK